MERSCPLLEIVVASHGIFLDSHNQGHPVMIVPLNLIAKGNLGFPHFVVPWK